MRAGGQGCLQTKYLEKQQTKTECDYGKQQAGHPYAQIESVHPQGKQYGQDKPDTQEQEVEITPEIQIGMEEREVQ